jgi:hypothetical protein
MNMDDDRFVTVFQKVGNMARAKFGTQGEDRRTGETGWHPSYGKNALRKMDKSGNYFEEGTIKENREEHIKALMAYKSDNPYFKNDYNTLNKFDDEQLEKYYKQTLQPKQTGSYSYKKENKEMKYTDVIKENIFKANGKLISEEQVLKITEKVPSRVKVDESVFAITDGENYYRLMWEGDESGTAVITHTKNDNQVNESIESMKKMWEFDPSTSVSSKKNITENGDEAFKRMFKQLRDSEGLVGENE